MVSEESICNHGRLREYRCPCMEILIFLSISVGYKETGVTGDD